MHSFFSAVVSAAAGTYFVTLAVGAAIATDLVIQPGQLVSITGNSGSAEVPSWGTGGFTVQQRGSLALHTVTINGAIAVAAGATLQMQGVTLEEFACLTAKDGSHVSLIGTATPPACSQCATIEHCTTSRCTSSGVAVCSACEEEHYSFRHDEQPGRCLSNSVTLLQAGFTTTAVGIYHFVFGGAAPSDLDSGVVTVPSTAQLFLTGTGAETVGASFAVHGTLALSALTTTKALLQTTIGAMGLGGTLSLAGVIVPDSAETLTGMVTVSANGTSVWQPQSMAVVLVGANAQCGQRYAPATYHTSRVPRLSRLALP